MFHKHKYGKVQDDGYQYCTKCGIAKKVECSHVWKDAHHTDITNRFGNVTGYLIIQQCTKCGEIKKFEVRVQ